MQEIPRSDRKGWCNYRSIPRAPKFLVYLDTPTRVYNSVPTPVLGPSQSETGSFLPSVTSLAHRTTDTSPLQRRNPLSTTPVHSSPTLDDVPARHIRDVPVFPPSTRTSPRRTSRTGTAQCTRRRLTLSQGTLRHTKTSQKGSLWEGQCIWSPGVPDPRRGRRDTVHGAPAPGVDGRTPEVKGSHEWDDVG